MVTHENHITDGARARILIVEDNRAIASALAIVLQHDGYETRWCDDESVYDVIEAWRPALILMDLTLPKLDGREATRRLKSDERTRHIPVIIVTAENFGVTNAGELRANDLLLKPFPVRRLLERVGSWINNPSVAEGTSAVAAATARAAVDGEWRVAGSTSEPSVYTSGYQSQNGARHSGAAAP